MLVKLTEREHIIQRPAMYIGSVDSTQTNDFILNGDKIEKQDIEYVPGLIKITNEIIDNCVDVAIKSCFKSGTKISVKMTKDFVEVQDNGTGIPVIKNDDGMYLPELAWGHARAGSNFSDDENRTQIGMNGVGSFATNCFSKKFVGCTDDGKNEFTITFKDNAESFTHKVGKTKGSTGTTVKFYPDLEKFGLTEIDDVHMNVIKQRLMNLSLSYPEIEFKFNGVKINVASFKKYAQMFSDDVLVYESPDGNYKFAITSNPEDEFNHFTYFNGLKIPDGGAHIDYITNQVVSGLREKIQKKYKNIKPADIKNKMTFIGFFTGFKNPKFNSQSKEKITNSHKEISDYLGNVDYDKIVTTLHRNKSFIEAITDVYRIKEEFKRRQELKGLSNTPKKIKSEKYLPSTKKKKYLVIAEGDSAIGGLSPVLGRSECGFYALKGKPLNTITADFAKFKKNTELSELFTIIKNEGYEKIVFGTDSDLDGVHIRGLLLGFIHKYLADYKHSIGILQTPVKIIKKNNKPVRWVYDINDELQPKSGETFKYIKGLGTWDKKDLQHIIKEETLDKMIVNIEFDDDDNLMGWLGKDSEYRKQRIVVNNFNIAKL